jgi:hypothetical protein
MTLEWGSYTRIVRKNTAQGFSLDVPDGWTFENKRRLTSLQADRVDAYVQVSLRNVESRRSAPSEETALDTLGRVVNYLSGRAERPPTETWRVGDSVCAWADFVWTDEDGVAQRYYGAGVRRWHDSYLLLTWHGSAETVSYRKEGRRIFESIDRTTTRA